MLNELLSFIPFARGLSCGLLAVLCSPALFAQNCGITRDLALVNGRIYQMNTADAMGLGLGVYGQPYLSASPEGGPPWRTILNSGAVALGGGSDGARINVLNPWCIIYYMVAGRDVTGALTNGDETVSRYQAVRYYASVEQGWFTKEEDTLGGIDVERFADLAVLSADVFDPNAVADGDIRHMSSVLTIVGGKIVHDAGIL